MNAPSTSPAEQIESFRLRLTQAYVNRDNAQKQVEQLEEEIAGLRNLLAGVQIGRDAERADREQA